MKITMEFHASELNAAMLAALNVLLVEDKREELRACGEISETGGEVVDAEYRPDADTAPLTASEMAARADAAQLREETLQIALLQDGADAGEMALPIRRKDVVLQVGDKVTFRTGEAGVVKEINEAMTQPAWANIGDDRSSCFTLAGHYWNGGTESECDIVSINGRPIIED